MVSGSSSRSCGSSMVVSSNGRWPASTSSTRPRLIDLVQVPTSKVATALPEKLVTARASDMKRSMPTIRPTPSTRSGRWEASPPARVASPAPVTPAAPLEAIIMNSSREICWRTENGATHRGGDEQRRHGQVDRGAVQVERVAGGHDDADRRLGDPEVLHLGHQPRQRRLRGRGGDDQQILPGQVLQHLEDVDPGDQLEQQTQDAEDEDGAGDVEGDHDHAQRLQRIHTGLTDDRGDGSESADRRRPHDHRQDAEDQPLQMTDADQDGLARLAHGLHGEPDQQRDQQRLQDDSAGQRGEHRLRDHVQQEVRGRGLLRRRRRLPGGQVQPLARVDDVADDQADGQAPPSTWR